MLAESDYVKIQVGVPESHADQIREVLGRAGAGDRGKYNYCSATHRVIGRFIPQEGANPAIGKIGQKEQVGEAVIQTLCHKDLVEDVVEAVRKAHPYEMPPIDIIPRLEIVE